MRKKGTSHVAKSADALWFSFLQQQRLLLEVADSEDDEDFCAIVNMMIRAGATQTELAERAKTVRTSIMRWKNDGPFPRPPTKIFATEQWKKYLDELITEAAAS